MVEEIRRQFQDPKVAEGTKEPDYNACVAIATQASLRQMVPPSVLVIFSPIVMGILFGKYTLAGMLPGAVVSGVRWPRRRRTRAARGTTRRSTSRRAASARARAR